MVFVLANYFFKRGCYILYLYGVTQEVILKSFLFIVLYTTV